MNNSSKQFPSEQETLQTVVKLVFGSDSTKSSAKAIRSAIYKYGVAAAAAVIVLCYLLLAAT